MPDQDNPNLNPEQRYLPSPEKAYRINMLRLVLRNHIQLSEMADNKANIIIGTSAVIFSLLLPQVNENGVKLHIVALLITAALAAFVSILSVSPRTRNWLQSLFRKARRQEPQSFNPLFFSAYVHLSEQDYVDYMFKNILREESDTCEAILIDLHRLGIILERKYQYLTYSYTIFAVGLILSALLLVIDLLS
ncbi:hypothetical protein Lepto7376_2147 [[Leptolyngbya] sp. PCC 7376]|uniref:Pycsar system effector family protein n=1 Tax=[Leptolyngbya] sp. PCC 7376 TaxID=111781 RepID=UPI00029F453C|nr:Pycsar system effector family protein [[Leptolyngbya] sp. PCC 7376]AFY38442.1 hypothetical protein Lepto7376_2147 [[Leptolyngbya] sp. PCC 7376]